MRQRLRTIATRFARAVRDDDLPGMAAELAYRFLFAIFPFALFVAALSAFVARAVGMANPAEQIVAALGDNLPPDLATALQPELERVVAMAQPGLVSAAALLTLWSATGGTNALIKATNRAYGVEESRSLPHRLVLAVGLTLLAGVGILVSFVTIVGGALLTEEIARRLNLTGPAWTAVTLLRWPLVFLILVVAVAILYRFAPNVRVAWKWALGGATVFALGWLVATAALAWWIGNVANYGATYGSLGGVIVLMLWFYVTGFLLVGAAELTAIAADVTEPEAIQRRRDEIAGERQLREAASRAKETLDTTSDGVRGAPAAGGPRHDRRRGPGDRRRVLRGAPPGA